jgi:hypothetical protein
MTLEDVMNEKLTIDSHARKLEDNYRGLLETPKFKRDIDQERYIKLNKLEQRAEPTIPVLKSEPLCGDYTLSCPSCGKPVVNPWASRAYQPHFCHYCGQALKWELPEEALI